MDRLEAMSIVLLVADKGSLTAAAKALNMSLPSISRKVSELEAHLGTKLMQRSTRKLTLTDSGEKYVEGARRVLEQLDDVERAASGEYSTPRGQLVLTAPVNFGQLYLLPLVTDFLAMYPEINVQLMLSDRNLHFLDDRVDMAIRLGALPDSNMVATRVGFMETLVCASPDLVAAHGVPKHPNDLQALPCVIFAGPATTTWSFREPNQGPGFGVDIVPRLSVSTAEGAVQAAVRRTGFTRIYRYHCEAHLRLGTLTRVLREFEVAPIPVHLVRASRDAMPLKMRVFLEFAADRLRTQLAMLD
jgi:DNA-binding transcriptional LysR family regulator